MHYVLLLSFCRCDLLKHVEMAFGVGELFDPLDLQATVFVSDDVPDDDRLAGHLVPECGFHLAGDLNSRRYVKMAFRAGSFEHGRE